MRRTIKFFICSILLCVGVFQLYAEQITTVAIINISEVISNFPSQTRGYENLTKLKAQYQSEINEQVAKLDSLKREHLLALKDEDYDSANSLKKKIDNLKVYITNLSERLQQELINRSKEPMSKEFLDKMQSAISFVAEEKGYTLVLQNTASGIQWWAPVIDITQDVIERLKVIN